MNRSTAAYEAPLPVQEVERRQGRGAQESFPKEPKIELARLWLGPQEEVTPTVRHENRGVRSLVVEMPPALVGVEAPDLELEAIDANSLSGIDVERDNQGFYPAHLPLTYKPKLIEAAREPRVIPEDRDLPNSVFPPDTRYIFQDTSFPWCTTGRVDTAGGSCTGTMIGRRLMLTGSHCMQWSGSGAGWVKFTPSYYNGSAPFGIAWGARVIYWMQANGSDGLSDNETGFDYVVIVLDRNLGDLTGYTGFRTYDSDWNGGNYWQQIGYPGDLSGSQRPAFFGGGAITSAQSQGASGQTGLVLGHFMDTFPGHSGGPYWGWWGDEPWPRIVGTDSTSPQVPGSTTAGDNEAGGGPALSSLIAYARQNYP